ncbi:hypothetical protein Tco_0064786 [Tanacetum coccineum]
MVPRAVLMKSGLVSVNTARQVNTAYIKATVNGASPVSNLSKTTHSTVKRPIHKNTSFKNNNFNQRVNTVKDKKFNTARPKEVFNAARPKAVVNAASITLKKFDYVNAQGLRSIDSGCTKDMYREHVPILQIRRDLEETPKEGKSQARVKVKTANREVQLQAPVDGKKIIITKASVRCDLQLNDEEATNQKFNFSKYIFESMVKNLENVSGKFLIPTTSQPSKEKKPWKSKRKDTEVPQPSGPTHNVVDDAVYEEIDDSLERAATTTTSLDAEQDMGNINKTQSKATLNEPKFLRNSFRLNLSIDEVTLAQALTALKSAKPKADKVMLQVPEQGTITTTTAATTITAASIRPKATTMVDLHTDVAVV